MLKRWRVWLVSRLTLRMMGRAEERRIGTLRRAIFRLPVLFHRLGWHFLIPGWILILGTQGRRTGRERLTALEYGYDAAQKRYFLMGGWGGRSDWYRNCLACPQVRLWVGGKQSRGVARAASPEEVADEMQGILAVWPDAVRVWAAYSGLDYDGTHGRLVQIASSFPSILVQAE